MKAFIRTEYGGPEVLHLAEVDKPSVSDAHVLVRVVANSVNPADWHIMRGEPFFARFVFGLFKPRETKVGADFSGVVEAVGNDVTRFRVGDRVFGETLKGGAFAEYACVPADVCARMPEGTDFIEMAGVPVAGLTALQALITHGHLKQGESVLVNGASGGVGHFLVQMAKNYGAEVTGVCSARNIEYVKALGADHVVPYDQQDIHHHQAQYDLVIDAHGNLTYDDFKRMGKRGVTIGFTSMSHMISVSLKRSFGKFPLTGFTAKANPTDLETLATLLGEGKIKVAIEKTYPYDELPKAIEYIERMHTRGKVAISWENNGH